VTEIRRVSEQAGEPGHAVRLAAGWSHRHRDVSGGWLRPTAFGAVDGLVTNASLIAGLGGGGAAAHTVVLTGVASLVAGAFSMGRLAAGSVLALARDGCRRHEENACSAGVPGGRGPKRQWP
jgi:VIT1/CCC1 family predicted Fe2+/Mn2+ transporter